MTASVLSEWQVEDWLVTRIAQMLRLPVEDVTSQAVFSELGLSSVQAVEVAAELEDWSGCEIPPTFVYECPSIQEAAAYVIAVFAAGSRGGTPVEPRGEPA